MRLRGEKVESKVYKAFWVTCYCDASFTNGRGGAWSIWLRSEKGRIVRSGVCPSHITDATLAEFYAAYMGVLISRDEWGAKWIQINSDCHAVVTGLGSGYRWSNRKSIRQIQDQILKSGVRIRTKHVKAHTGENDTRSYLNRQCDKMANKIRREL